MYSKGRDMRHTDLLSSGMALLLCCLVILPSVSAADVVVFPRTVEPSAYYGFSEGSGDKIFDLSGNGNFGTLYNNVSRFDNGDCGKAVTFDGRGSYIAIPPNRNNHPVSEVTAEARFLLNNLTDASMVSTLNNGGYRLGFGDGNDLWWTVNVEGTGDVSVSIRNEEISLSEWHSAAGTYDGKILKLYIDGKMYASKEARGSIHYSSDNFVILGAEAGTEDTPPADTAWFSGALDEVRIYTVALTNGEVIDDMVACAPEKGPVDLGLPPSDSAGFAIPAGSLSLVQGESKTELLRFDAASTIAPWHVTVPAGSYLAVSLADLPATYPNRWQIDITDGSNILGQTTWTPGGKNFPAEAS